jgi:uracil DNA glycosylase
MGKGNRQFTNKIIQMTNKHEENYVILLIKET